MGSPHGIRATAILAATVIAAIGLIAPAATAQEPRSIAGLSDETQLSQADRAAVEEYANFWMERLVDDQFDVADRARQKLMEPVARNPSEVFRDAYGGNLMRHVGPIIRSAADRPYAATNSVILLSRVGTERAIEMLVANASARQQSEWWLRLVAAKNAAEFMASNRTNSLQADFLSGRISDLARAAEAETNPGVLRYQLLALLNSDSDRFAANSRTRVFDHISSGLGAAVSRSATDHQMLAATDLMLTESLQPFLAIPRASQPAFAKKVVPQMVALLEGYAAVGPDLDPKVQQEYGKYIQRLAQRLERFCAVGMSRVQRPSDDLADAWNDGKFDDFRASVQRWKAAIENAG